MTITIIAAVDTEFGIGNSENDLLFDYANDKKHFKSITSGKIVVMGRRTWESLPKKPLEKRKNYVLTGDYDFSPAGAKTVNSIGEILQLGKKHDIYIIGGSTLYKQLMPFADKMILTHIHTKHPDSAVFFPEFTFKDWKLETMTENEADELHDHSYTFATYSNKNKITI